MGVSFTPEQRQVIDLRKRNILVSAAAGSGKTAVLVERIKKRVLEDENPVDIDELLVVTFTNAAAAQMRDRIGAAIEAEMVQNPSNARFQQQLALVHHAQITTIDSFCLYVIRNHFHEIDLEPNFRIADEGELKLLKEEVMDTLLERAYASGSEDFLNFADTYVTGRNDNALRSMILQLYDYAGSYPWPKEWLISCEENYAFETMEELTDGPLFRCLMTYLANMAKGLGGKMERTLALCLAEGGPYMYESAIKSDIEQIKRLEEVKTYQEAFAWMQSLSWAKLKSARGFDGDLEIQEYVKAARDKWKNTVKAIKEKFFFLSPEHSFLQIKRLMPFVHTLIALTIDFMDDLAKKKRDKNIVDFGDMEHFALEILVDRKTKEPTAAAQEFQRAYAEIMIDEYQDSNYVQETILRAISREKCGENNIFMVGDVKQSIYRFRLARPELFMEKFDAYSLEESDRQRIDLHKNFRSRNEVLEITNDIFRHIMKKDLGNVAYDKAAELYPGASYPQVEQMFAPEILIADSEDELPGELGADQTALEAHMIAGKILDMKKNQLVTDEKTGTMRTVNYKDIVILLRSLSGSADVFTEILMNYGIPVHTSSKTGYFSALEVQTVLNYLRILDNPFQDIPLAAVLKSPIGGFTEEELAQVRISNQEKMFCHAFFDGVKGKAFPTELLEKAEAFCHVYEMLREEILDRPIHELLLAVLEKTGYERIASAMPGGRQRQANLAMLVEKAIAYEGTSYRGLFHFIRYMDELHKYDVDFGEAELVGENEDAVRIMSIHKSKGLEFPVVFVSGLGRRFNKQDSRSRMILHHEFGLGLDEIDKDRRLKVPTIYKRILANQSDLENLGEELRILYVALTRAKEKLVLTAAGKQTGGQIRAESVRNGDVAIMTFSDIAGASCYLDWVVDALTLYGEKYEIVPVGVKDLVWQEAKTQIHEKQTKEEWDAEFGGVTDEMQTFVRERLFYQYPHQSSVDLQMKYSVSELKHRAMRKLAAAEELETIPDFLEKPVIPYIPAFVSEGGGQEEIGKGALRGTAVHRVLECLDFVALSEDNLIEDVKVQIEQMLEEARITPEMKEMVSVKAVADFLKSPVGLCMRAAAKRGELYREKPFVLGRQEEELILVQGIIDVFWMENGRIHLLDYKTDRVSSGTQLVELYKEQMNLYADALRAVWNMEVEEKILYSFSLHQAVYV